VIWVALALQLLSGFVLWMTKPAQYIADTAFVLKSLLVIVGIVLTLSFYKMILREAPSWEKSGTISSRSVKFVAATLLVWCGVIIASRLTAHLGSL
jgi:nitrate reductase gamma subunit